MRVSNQKKIREKSVKIRVIRVIRVPITPKMLKSVKTRVIRVIRVPITRNIIYSTTIFPKRQWVFDFNSYI